MSDPHHDDFGDRRLRRGDLASDPMTQFAAWLEDAVGEAEADPFAMTLATNNPGGGPSSRTVELKQATTEGFVFTTRLDGPKARELAVDPTASIVFYWPGVARQVRARGTTRRLPDDHARRLYAQRPRDAQLAQHVRTQSEVIEEAAIIEREAADLARRFGDGDIPMPDWAAYLIDPQQVEFWQGRTNRLHDRFRYTLEPEGTWRLDRLVP